MSLILRSSHSLQVAIVHRLELSLTARLEHTSHVHEQMCSFRMLPIVVLKLATHLDEVLLLNRVRQYIVETVVLELAL